MSLAHGEKNVLAWAELPPLDGANRFRELKPGAQVLATTDNDQPLLVAKDYGAGRVLAFAGDSTWHWWMHGHEALHKRFWRQTVLWLARKDQTNEGNVWLSLDKRRYSPGARVEFTMGAKSPTGEPIADVVWQARVKLPNGNLGQTRLRHQGDEMSGLFLDALAPGDYVVQVEAKAKGQTLGTAQARFLVYEQDLEMDNPAADLGAMESLAVMTGGRAVAPEQLPNLLAELKQAAHNFEIETQIKHTLWDTWPFFSTLVGLLLVEWYLRKRWGLV